MPTNLIAVKDHPANVLRAEATQHSITSSVYITGADVLSAYEAANGVTFAALDNEAYKTVQEAYAAFEHAPYGSEERLDLLAQIADGVRDLLGLAD